MRTLLLATAGLLGVFEMAGQPAMAQAPMPRGGVTLSSGGESQCQGRDIRIDGDGQSYTLLGGCRSVTVTGTGNSVHAELQPQATISAGHGNRVYWFLRRDGQPPTVVDAQADSQVLQEQRLGSTVLPTSATPPAPDALTLTGDKPLNEADCAGRDAVITGNNARFVLHGRCRSIGVTGDHDTVEAEMLAGSRIRIDGDHSVVQFALVSTGPDPIVSVQGTGSAAWRIQRLGATSRADASSGVAPTASGMRVTGGKGADVNQMHAVPESEAQ